MSRTRVRRRRTTLVVALAALGAIVAGPLRPAAAGWAATGSSAAEAPARLAARTGDARRYVVAPGDTVWGIAVRLGRGGDPRQLVDAIADANDVDPGVLRPGQVLVIPSV
jgi:nucleoid-associated protein YgaU